MKAICLLPILKDNSQRWERYSTLIINAPSRNIRFMFLFFNDSNNNNLYFKYTDLKNQETKDLFKT